MLLTRLKNPQHRLAYAQSAITHGWSRNVLNIQIDKSQPMGIADYKLLESLPAELQSSLPSIEQIERELGGTDTSMENDAQ